MINPLLNIQIKSRDLANHHQSYLHVIGKYFGELKDALEKKGHLERINLFTPTINYSNEMEIISALSNEPKKRIEMLSCYYSLQLLIMNIRNLYILKSNVLDIKESRTFSDKYIYYEDFMKRMGFSFRGLSASYMDQILRIYDPNIDYSGFTIMGVGTRADQDDIDIAVVNSAGAPTAPMNRVFSKLRDDMMRYATPLHFYLSEQFHSYKMSASIEEYAGMIKNKFSNFVIISEILSATRILGSYTLYTSFMDSIASKYFCINKIGAKFRINMYHEGFLRGILGEVRSLISKPDRESTLHPKEDGLRVIKGLIYALKSILNINRTYSWDILSELREIDSDNDERYLILARGLDFLETFRLVYQILISEDEEIPLREQHSKKNLQKVAVAMGYRDAGSLKSYDHLLVDYYEQTHQIKNAIEFFLEEIRVHLLRISSLNAIARKKDPQKENREHFLLRFLKISKPFYGAKYWDDIIYNLERKDYSLLDDFLNEFSLLNNHQKSLLIKSYTRCGLLAIHALLKLINLLKKYSSRNRDAGKILNELNRRFIHSLSRSQEHAYEFIKVFHPFPEIINSYLSCLDTSDLEVLINSISKCDVYETELTLIKNRLLRLMSLYLYGSHYFKRYFTNVFDKFPEVIRSVTDTGKIKELAIGFYSKLLFSNDFLENIKNIGHYFDLEFVRLGIHLLEQRPISEINREFTEVSDECLQALFIYSKGLVELQHNTKIKTENTLGIFVSGGHAREQAFADDYDIIIVLDSNDEKLKNMCSKIISKMNTEIIRRSILPQYRFMDYFDSYIATFSEIRSLLEKDNPGIYVEQSQLLGCRLVYGSESLENRFYEGIVKPFIIEKKEKYIRRMADEIIERAIDSRNNIYNIINIKEQPGGLRDIEMVLLIIKAFLDIRININSVFIDEARKQLPQIDHEIYYIFRSMNLLKNIRDILRLTTSASDEIELYDLGYAASVLKYGTAGTAPSRALYNDIVNRRNDVMRNISKIMDFILGSNSFSQKYKAFKLKRI